MEQPHSALALLAVDRPRPGPAWGRLWLPGMERPQEVSGQAQLLLALQQPPTPPGERAPAALDMAPGRLATFTVHVRFRQHASLQGFLRPREGPALPFRSALELLRLLDRSLARPSYESEGLS